MNRKIGIIGMGHMGKALEQGLLASGFAKEQVITSNSAADNRHVAEQSDWIILAVKPSVLEEVVKQLKDTYQRKVLLSVAAGVSVAQIVSWSGNKDQKVIRLMPNLPISCRQGVLGFFANDKLSEREKAEVKETFSGLGEVIDCTREEEIDVITLLAGCGAGIVAYLMTLFEKSGQSFGLSQASAEKIALQTFVGTLAYLHATGQTPGALQQSVATKGGVTEEIIQSMEKSGMNSTFLQSLEKGYDKIRRIKG